jgi:hypothetical protein
VQVVPDGVRHRDDASTHASAPAVAVEPVVGLADAPPVLTERIHEAISVVAPGHSLATASPEVLLQAAESLFSRALRTGCSERTSAVALLVVDALVTYAFERASDDPDQIERRAAAAIGALAGLAAS